MKELSNVINWPEEIRNFIITKINEIERVRAVERAIKILEKVLPVEQGTAKKLIREDRASHRCFCSSKIHLERGRLG